MKLANRLILNAVKPSLRPKNLLKKYDESGFALVGNPLFCVQ